MMFHHHVFFLVPKSKLDKVGSSVLLSERLLLKVKFLHQLKINQMSRLHFKKNWTLLLLILEELECMQRF